MRETQRTTFWGVLFTPPAPAYLGSTPICLTTVSTTSACSTFTSSFDRDLQAEVESV